MGRRVFYGWWIVSLGAIINGVGGGIIYQSFTVFFLPLKRDLGVSSASISLLYGAARLEGGIEGPIVGHLIDRFGSRLLIIIGASLTGIGLILLSTVHSFFAFFLIYVFIVGFGSNSVFFHPVSAAVNKWFIRRRGIGFSIVSASGNVGVMFLAPLLSYIILDYGWRYGAIFSGLIILVITLPCALPIKKSPEVMGLYPDGRPPPVDPVQDMSAVPLPYYEVNFTVRQALRTLTFWLLMLSISLRLLVTVALNTHFVPILVWKGMSEVGGAFLVSVSAFSCILSSIALGWMGDRWNKAMLSSLCLIPTMIAMGGMVFSQESAFIYFFPVAFAITMGTAPLNWALIGDFFGRGAYATIRGIMGIGYGTATFFSPIYAGWIFDRTESYAWVLITFTIILLITGILFAILRHPSPPPSKHNER